MMGKGPGKLRSVLVVDDEENLRHMLSVTLGKQGYAVDQAANGEEALEKSTVRDYDFILCDIRMPVMDGPAFLARMVERGGGTTIIMMSAYGTMTDALDCMKQGAYDFISKPFKNDEIVLTLRKAEEREKLKRENRRLKKLLGREYSFAHIYSKNPRMQEIFTLVRKVADFRTTVLVLGESGTGKELIARAVHFNSNRRSAPFVAVNCGAIPESLLESELFGHVRGAFTDASGDKAGLFEQANGGTLFLDEIGELPLPLQVKLLRVLQEGEIRRVGATASVPIDARVISATSKDLAREVAEQRFREDLFFRLNVFSIVLPPLRERLEDIPLLVDHFLEKYGERYGLFGVSVTSGFIHALMEYTWPGNVRELENCVERALVLCDGGDIDEPCLPATVRAMLTDEVCTSSEEESLSIKRAEAALERRLIAKALAVTGGNRTHAAKLLDISHRALLYKIKEFGIC